MINQRFGIGFLMVSLLLFIIAAELSSAAIHAAKSQRQAIHESDMESNASDLYRDGDLNIVTGVNGHVSGQSLRSISFDRHNKPDNIHQVTSVATSYQELRQSGQSYKWITNGPYSGAASIHALSVSSNFASDGTIFAAVRGGLRIAGIYKSTDKGASWTNCALGEIGGMGTQMTLGISPGFNTDQTLFAGAWGIGLFKSTDGCASWSNNIMYDDDVEVIAISPNYANDHTIFVGTHRTPATVRKSIDGGETWVSSSEGLPDGPRIEDLIISSDYEIDRTLFVGMSHGGGAVFKSTDAGSTWHQSDNGMNTTMFFHDLAISPDFVNDRTVFAASDEGLFESTDSGVNWTQVSYSFPRSSVASVAISPNYSTDQTLYAGSRYSIYKSTDAGLTWNNVLIEPPSPAYISSIRVLVFSPAYATDETIFAGTGAAGILMSSNDGQSWSFTNNGFTGISIYSMAIAPSDERVFAGSHPRIYVSDDMGESWEVSSEEPWNSRVMAIEVSPAYSLDSIVFVGTFLDGVYKSTDGGLNWTSTQGVNGELHSMAISPMFYTDGEAFVGISNSIQPGIHKSNDFGETWILLSSEITQTVNALAVSPNYAVDQTVFAAVEGHGVLKSTDAGTTWIPTIQGLASQNIFDLVISPKYRIDEIVYAAASDGIYKTSNGGAYWIKIYPIHHYGVDTITISPNFENDGTVFAGSIAHTLKGVLVTTDAGETWSLLGEGLPNYRTSSLVVSSSQSQILFNGTLGSGIWQLPTRECAAATALSICHIEITQVIQDESNSVPLISEKPTFVRVFVDCGVGCTSLSDVSGSLEVSWQGGRVTLTPENGPITAYHSHLWTDKRGDLDKSLNFLIPTNIPAGSIRFTATVNSATKTIMKTFNSMGPLRIGYVSIEYDGSTPDARLIAGAYGYLSRLYPLHQVDYFPVPVSDPYIRGQWDWAVKLYLNILYKWYDIFGWPEPNGSPDQLFGWVPDATWGLGGNSDPRWDRGEGLVAYGSDTTINKVYQTIMAHEIGHNYGRRHPICDFADPDWPHSDYAINDVGFDFGVYHRFIPNQLISDDTDELMIGGHCGADDFDDKWVSSFTYKRLYGALSGQESANDFLTYSASEKVVEEQPVMLVSGRVFTDSVAELDAAYQLVSVQAITQVEGTQYCLSLEDSGGTILSSSCFDLSFVDPEWGTPQPFATFVRILPHNEEAVRLVLTHGNTQLEQRIVSQNLPVATLLKPNGGEVISTTVDVLWEATDADDDPMEYTLSYSADTGQTWFHIGTGITETHLLVDTQYLPGSNDALFRVTVSDGFNSTYDESDGVFAMVTHNPTAFILTPDNGTFSRPQAMLLQGYAYDPEDGPLQGTRMNWISDKDGNLGTGEQLIVSLSQGHHIITLEAVDSDNHIGTSSIVLYIGDRQFLPIVLK